MIWWGRGSWPGGGMPGKGLRVYGYALGCGLLPPGFSLLTSLRLGSEEPHVGAHRSPAPARSKEVGGRRRGKFSVGCTAHPLPARPEGKAQCLLKGLKAQLAQLPCSARGHFIAWWGDSAGLRGRDVRWGSRNRDNPTETHHHKEDGFRKEPPPPFPLANQMSGRG